MTPNFLKEVYIVVDDKIKGKRLTWAKKHQPRNLSYVVTVAVLAWANTTHILNKTAQIWFIIVLFLPCLCLSATSGAAQWVEACARTALNI